MLPNRIGRYQVLGQLATGGMAEILLACLEGPSDFRRAVVIKRILRQYARNGSFVAMFLDEARTVARIRHPNVVQVQELGEHEGDVFLVLEYVAGENLSSMLKRATTRGAKMEPELVAHVVAEACAGLHAAHELVSDDGKLQNLVHRDVSPQNIFVAYDGHVKLLDFGVAITDERITRTEVGDVKGKFEYMSPEHANGAPLDRRSDIFAMGVVLYELGTGRRLFKRTSHARTLDAITKEPVIPPSRLVEGFPAALETVVMRALAKRPDERYATAAEMRRDLLEIARALPSPVESLADRMRDWFPDRIAEKEELLRRVRDGDQVTHIPEGEVEESIRVPRVPDGPEAPNGAPRSEPPPSLAPRAFASPAAARAPSWPIALVIAGIAALTVVGVGVGIATTARRSSGASADAGAAPAAAAPAGSMPGSVAPGRTSSTILIHVESRPPGAHVLSDGVDRGTTPLDVHVERGTVPLVLELRSPGFAAATQSVVPDIDQRLLLALQPLGAPNAAAGAPVGGTARVPGHAPTARPRVGSAPSRPLPSASPSGFRRFD